VLSDKQRHELTVLAHSSRAPFRIVIRARIALLAADGHSNKDTAKRLCVTERTVCKWRKRIAENPDVETLKDTKRSGRPPQVALTTRLHLIKLACRRPEGNKAPFREIWTQQALADALLKDTGVKLSRTEVRRVLSNEGFRPHRVRQWLHSPDPQFAEKVERICALYLDPPKDAIVLCIDEKPMQVLARKHPTKIGPRAVVRREFEYKRHGTRVLLGAFDVADGSVFGQVVPHRTGEALVAYMNEVAHFYPDRQVYVVWDNLNVHFDGPDKRWTEFNAVHGGRFHFVHTPLHASWVNQVEIWFSILERRVLKYGSFASPEELTSAVSGFIRHWNLNEAHPFRWTFRGRFEQSRLMEAV
jgi:transposase